MKDVISGCPKDPDETAESLYMGRLDASAVRKFRAHMRVCRVCRKVYESNVVFVDAIRGAAKLLHQNKPAKVALR